MPLHWWHLFCRSTYIRFQGLYLLAPYKRIMYILGPEIQQGLDKIGSLQQIFGASLHISSTRFHHHFLKSHFRYLQQIFGLPMLTVSRYVIINNDLQNQSPHLLFDLHHNFLHKYLLTASLPSHFYHLCLKRLVLGPHFISITISWTNNCCAKKCFHVSTSWSLLPCENPKRAHFGISAKKINPRWNNEHNCQPLAPRSSSQRGGVRIL